MSDYLTVLLVLDLANGRLRNGQEWVDTELSGWLPRIPKVIDFTIFRFCVQFSYRSPSPTLSCALSLPVTY